MKCGHLGRLFLASPRCLHGCLCSLESGVAAPPICIRKKRASGSGLGASPNCPHLPRCPLLSEAVSLLLCGQMDKVFYGLHFCHSPSSLVTCSEWSLCESLGPIWKIDLTKNHSPVGAKSQTTWDLGAAPAWLCHCWTPLGSDLCVQSCPLLLALSEQSSSGLSLGRFFLNSHCHEEGAHMCSVCGISACAGNGKITSVSWSLVTVDTSVPATQKGESHARGAANLGLLFPRELAG